MDVGSQFHLQRSGKYLLHSNNYDRGHFQLPFDSGSNLFGCKPDFRVGCSDQTNDCRVPAAKIGSADRLPHFF